METTTTVTNTVAGNPIATYTNEEDADVVINETITTLDTMGQTIVYTDEAGNATTIDLTGLETLTSISIDDAAGTILM